MTGTTNTDIEGLSATGVSLNGHPEWFEPTNGADEQAAVLKVHNSLTRTIQEFKPRVKRTVSWYVCGPTVYDVCHMGHARAYLTFDILRRIIQDYFNYDVFYQINITDIDDKIILRARRNKLVEDYIAQGLDFSKAEKDVEQALLLRKDALEKKSADLLQPLPSTATEREAEERNSLILEHELKQKQFLELEESVKTASQTKDGGALLQVAKDVLGEYLDAKFGSTVTDKSIFLAHTRKFENEYLDDMAALGVREPDVLTRVTDYVPQIVDYIAKIIDNGFAYESNGSVYFDTVSFSKDYAYRKLYPAKGDQAVSAAEMAEGEGALGAKAEGEKKCPNDFALWKRSKTGEPAWESPWGSGRPGWHIECSVMASDVIGSNIDIHGGGVDLKFPHHDNEIAQAEAYHQCKQWVNYFFHAGHLHIKGLKMSKSLKNFITIKQALQEHSARQLRLMFLLQAWDKPMNYSDQTVSDAKSKESLFKNFFGEVKALQRSAKSAQDPPQTWTDIEHELNRKIHETQEKVHSALLDNFDTPSTITVLCDLVSSCNKYISATSSARLLLLNKAARYITKILKVFGVIDDSSEIGFPAQGQSSNLDETVSPYMDALVDFRENVRKAALDKDDKLIQTVLQECDRVRDEALIDIGVRLEDRTGTKAVWKLEDPAALKKERDEVRAAAAAIVRQKISNKIDKRKKELEKWVKASKSPQDLFKSSTLESGGGTASDETAKYGALSEAGVPTVAANGEALSKKATKSVENEMRKAVEEHNKFLAKLEKEPSFLDDLKSEIEELTTSLEEMN